MIENNNESYLSKGCAQLPSPNGEGVEGEAKPTIKEPLKAVVHLASDYKNYKAYKSVTQPKFHSSKEDRLIKNLTPIKNLIRVISA